jgi:hypothetical protein
MTRVLNAQDGVVAEIRFRERWVLAIPMLLGSVVDAWRFQQGIEAALKAANRRLVLIDARLMPLLSREVNDRMWTWAVSSPQLDALAIVNQSPVLTIAARMRALAIGTRRIGIFTEPSQAASWLLTQPSRKAVSEIRRVGSGGGRIHLPATPTSKRQR